MNLILETGAGLADANAYADLVAFAAFADAHLYAAAYTAATDDNRKRALVMATRNVDSGMKWNGIRATPVQALEWPRAYADRQPSLLGPIDVVSTFYAAGLAQRYWLPTEIPKLLATAICDFALELLRIDRTAEVDEKGLKRLALGQGAVELEFDKDDRRGLFPPNISRQLSIFGVPAGRSATIAVRRAY